MKTISIITIWEHNIQIITLDVFKKNIFYKLYKLRKMYFYNFIGFRNKPKNKYN